MIAVVCVCAPAAAQISPGALSSAHAKLDDDQSCGKCHASGKGIDEKKCLDCHPALAAQIAGGRGLHASYRGRPCAGCHVEHLGEKARLIRWPGGAADKLDHKLVGWPLLGAHAQTSCAKCHDQRTAAGAPTFLGKKAACASCHDDPHAGRLGAACAGCHDAIGWKTVKIAAFDHTRTAFPLVGKHAAVDCKGCHGEPARYTGIAFASCTSCHQDPHKGQFSGACESCHSPVGWKKLLGFDARHPALSLANGHKKVACATCHDRGTAKPPSRGSECVSCHKPVHEEAVGTGCKTCHATIKWLGLPREIGLATHQKTSFPLRGAHVTASCTKCHDPSFPLATRYRGLDAGSCGACHRDPHPPGLRALASDCSGCHGDTTFVPARMTVALHARTGFALEGKHDATPCSACHVGARPRVAFVSAGRDCASCHKNPHGDEFRVEMAQGGCAHCHGADDFHRAKVDHSFWPLTGGHARTACKACHGDDYKSAPRQCDGCHADPHEGQFRLNAPVRACDACHSTERFPGFAAADHDRLFGYELAGKHATTECGACHPGERLRDGQTVIRWRLGYRACRACHADPHGAPS